MEKESLNKVVCRSLCATSKFGLTVAAIIAALSLQSCVEWLIEPFDVNDFKDFVQSLNNLGY